MTKNLHYEPTHSWSDGIWSITDLYDVASDLLDMFEKERGVIFNRRKRKRRHRGHDLASIIAVPQTIGPYIIDSDTALAFNTPLTPEGYMQLDSKFGIPEFSFVAINCKQTDEDWKKGEDKNASWVMAISERINSLDLTQVRPTGPGYPYLSNIIYFWEDRKHFSYPMFFTIDTEGRVWPCKVLVKNPYYIPGRQNLLHTPPHWEVPEEWTKPVQKNIAPFCEMAGILMNFGITVDNHWNLRVERATSRHKKYPLAVNVVINEQLVIRLFKDRDKVEHVMSPTGRRRPILHWAKAHYRTRKQKPKNWIQKLFWKLFPRLQPTIKKWTVRTHLRGIRDFILNGHRCFISLPGYHRKTRNETSIVTWWIDDDEAQHTRAREGDELVESQIFSEKDHPDWSRKKARYYPGPSKRHAA